MKCLVIAYIKSEQLLSELEGIMYYYKFSAIENNTCYRVFQGDAKPNSKLLAMKLNTQLNDVVFDIEDSLFIAYPVITDNGIPSLANIIIKRKGNKHLRREETERKLR